MTGDSDEFEHGLPRDIAQLIGEDPSPSVGEILQELVDSGDVDLSSEGETTVINPILADIGVVLESVLERSSDEAGDHQPETGSEGS